MNKSKNLLAWLYIIAVFFVVPLYNEGSFDNITQRKVVAYQMICGVALGIYLLVSLVMDIRRDESGVSKKRFRGASDLLIFLFVVVMGISTILSDFRKDAFYGVQGFGMGFLTILLMVLSYFFISRNLVCSEKLLYLVTLSSVIPTLLLIVNRLGCDPLGMYPEGAELTRHLYVSTFGNYGWYNQYMSVIIPISIYMVFAKKELLVRVLYVMHLLLCAAAWILAGTKTLMVSSIAVLCAIWMWKMLVKERVQITPKLFLSMAVPVITSYGLGIVFGMSSDSFANGRGYIWWVSGELLKNFNIREWLFGVGPNCYTYALDEFLLTDADLLAEFNGHFPGMALTSAHSEYFDYLINGGVVGVLIYVVMLCAFIYSFIKNDKTTDCQKAAILCVISYAVYSLFTFSTVCATPMMFIMLGILTCEGKMGYD